MDISTLEKTYKTTTDTDVAVELGLRYFFGINGAEQNEQKALVWFSEAALLNNAVAQAMLGMCYYTGWGCKMDKAFAGMWFEKSAKLGYPDAQLVYGNMLLSGDGIEIDEEEGIKWLQRSADQKANARVFLNNYYGEKGEKQMAFEQLEKAVADENEDSWFWSLCLMPLPKYTEYANTVYGLGTYYLE